MRQHFLSYIAKKWFKHLSSHFLGGRSLILFALLQHSNERKNNAFLQGITKINENVPDMTCGNLTTYV